MTTKAQIRKDQASAIESFLEHNSKKELLEGVVRGSHFTGTWAPINSLSFDELATALYTGYEIKKTPEELVREYYEDMSDDYEDSSHYSREETQALAKMVAIKETLRRLDIKIKGVND